MDVAAEHQGRVFGPRQRSNGDSESGSSAGPRDGEIVRLGRFGELGGELLSGDCDPHKYVPRAATVALGVPGRELKGLKWDQNSLKGVIILEAYL